MAEKQCTACQAVFRPEIPHQRVCSSCRGQCRVEGCLAVPKARGLCARHLQRVYAHGHAGPAERVYQSNRNQPCQLEGCYLPAVTRGWCRRHYERWHTTGDPGPVAIGWKH